MCKQREWIRDLLIRPFNYFLEPRYTQLARGARLTPKRLECIIMGDIWPRERDF
jgi:hypothetical protein